MLSLSVSPLAQRAAEFEVVSIKRNTTNTFTPEPATNVATGHYWRSDATAASLVLQGYPVEGVPEMLNLPSWATSEHFDVLAKGKPGATPAEQQQMWRALLADRLKVQAHYEPRPQQGYRLVLARGEARLGADIRRSALDCSSPPQPAPAGTSEVTALQRCGWLGFGIPGGQAFVSGGATMASLARVLSGVVMRSVVDATGLDGDYAVRIQYAPQRTVGAPVESNLPSIFIALQEQLGLKLEAATVDVPALVIDHIERPTEN